ncbi:MAG: GNAT family N-acetyltransferase [Gemmatimonadales bacterium]
MAAAPMPPPEPVTLVGRFVRLEPLTLDHHTDLCAVGLEPALWRWTWDGARTAAELRRYIETALVEQAAGRSLPFAIVEQAGGRAIGSTRYGNIEPAHRRLEIGWTWLGAAWRRTACNTDCKLLLLTHAFEALGYQRVEFKTDALNAPSRAALLRIGATEEGTFRKHGITADGRIRDTVYFSIVDDEWSRVKARLVERLALGVLDSTR